MNPYVNFLGNIVLTAVAAAAVAACLCFVIVLVRWVAQ